MLGFTPSWTWREASLSESGRRTLGYRFRLPVSLGATEFETLESIEDVRFESLDAYSIVPGVEIEIPFTERWRIKSQAFVGIGAETGGGDRAKIFRFGVRSQFIFAPGKTRIALVNGIERFGFSADSGPSNAINLVQTGLEFNRNLQNSTIGAVPVALSWHLLYTHYVDSLGLDVRDVVLKPQTLRSEWEVGVAFRKQQGPLLLWRLKLDRFGIAYRFDSEGDYSGYGLVFRSLFDR